MNKHKNIKPCVKKAEKQSRHVIEKKRRDAENEALNKIKSLLPYFPAHEKTNKLTILQHTNGFLRFLRVFEPKNVKPLPPAISNAFESLIESGLVNTFTLDCGYNILWCDPSAFLSLGYRQSDVVSHNFTELIYEHDVEDFKRFMKGELEKFKSKDSESLDFNTFFRMYDKTNRSNGSELYRLVNFKGSIYYNNMKVLKRPKVYCPSNKHIQLKWDEMEIDHNYAFKIKGSIFICVNPEISYKFITEYSYKLVMTLDGKIKFAGQLLALFTGHYPEDVLGKSAYEYITEDDRGISLVAHRRTLEREECTGIIVHRLDRPGKTGKVFLRSQGYVENNQDETLFITIVTPLSDEEGEKLRREHLAELTPHFKPNNSNDEKTIKELKVSVSLVAERKFPSVNKNAQRRTEEKTVSPINLVAQPETPTFSVSSLSSLSAENSPSRDFPNETSDSECITLTPSPTSYLPLQPSIILPQQIQTQLSSSKTSFQQCPSLICTPSSSSSISTQSSQVNMRQPRNDFGNNFIFIPSNDSNNTTEFPTFATSIYQCYTYNYTDQASSCSSLTTTNTTTNNNLDFAQERQVVNVKDFT